VRRILGGACVVALVFAATWLISCSQKSTMAPLSYGAGSGAELSGSLPSSGTQYVHTFTKAGAFPYGCTIHPSCASLQGTIVVVGAGTAIQNRVLAVTLSGGGSGPYGSVCSSLSVSTDTVMVGDQVTWTNTSTLPHTVTSR
jgi:hypothetical protein